MGRRQIRPSSPPTSLTIREVRRFSSPTRVPTARVLVADARQLALRRYEKTIPFGLTTRRTFKIGTRVSPKPPPRVLRAPSRVAVARPKTG